MREKKKIMKKKRLEIIVMKETWVYEKKNTYGLIKKINDSWW